MQVRRVMWARVAKWLWLPLALWRLWRAVGARNRHDWDSVVRHMEWILRRSSASSCHFMLAMGYAFQKRDAEALEQFEQVRLPLWPVDDDLTCRMSHIITLRRVGREDEADKRMTELLEYARSRWQEDRFREACERLRLRVEQAGRP